MTYGVNRTIALTIKVQSGLWTQFGAVDGGPDEIGWTGTYRVVDDDTIVATSGPCAETYTFNLEGNQLRVQVVSCECSGAKAPEEEWIAQVTIYNTAPFTRVG